jgi:sodium pump decarboxylase gamma subunit
MLSGEITMTQAGMVCIFSLLVVFAVLLALIGIIQLTSAFSKPRKKEPKGGPVKEETRPVEEESEDETVLIMAAIAAYLGTDQFVVRSISPVTSWQAGTLRQQLH